jgi:hypothetical protein
VSAARGSIVRPKFSIGEHGFVSIISDTEGNMIGPHSVASRAPLRARCHCTSTRHAPLSMANVVSSVVAIESPR